MNLDAAMSDWSPPIFIAVGCALALVIYLRGYFLLRRTRPEFPAWRVWSYCAGVVTLWVSLGSPLEELADNILTAHMIEHQLLMMIVPPLVLMGWPTVPLLRGLPKWIRRYTAAPLLRSRAMRRLGDFLVRPLVAWMAMNVSLLVWHLPAAYDFAVNHEPVHDFEHVCFLVTSLMFWWVLIRPWPSKSKPLGWMGLFYLISADLVNTVLSAFLTFVGHPVYQYYLQNDPKFGIDPINDQALGGALMWVIGSTVFLIPLVGLLNGLLTGKGPKDAF